MGIKKTVYPDNLLIDLNIDILSRDMVDVRKGIEYAISELSKTSQLVINERYKNQKLFKEIGDMLGVSSSRASALCRHALRMMRHPLRSDYIRYGYEKNLERLNEIETRKKMKLENTPESAVAIREKSLDDLDLSVRSYNCIRRSNINTVGELADHIREKKKYWRNIRGLGNAGASEIFAKLRNLNVVSGTMEAPFVLLPDVQTTYAMMFGRSDGIKLYERIKEMNEYQLAEWLVGARMDIFFKCDNIESALMYIDG